jgi:hypothetical protein
LYPGDKTFWISKKQRRSEESDDDMRVGFVSSRAGVTLEHYKESVELGRLCSTIEDIHEHFYSVCPNKGNSRIPGEQVC